MMKYRVPSTKYREKSKRFLLKLFLLFFTFFSFLGPRSSVLGTEATVPIRVTVIIASNEGNDFDLVNDEYRDQLIELFSYKAYRQVDEAARKLERSRREKVALPDGYELVLTLQEVEKSRVNLQAVIRRGNKQYVDTILSVARPGVVFVGGPPAGKGAIIIVLETEF